MGQRSHCLLRVEPGNQSGNATAGECTYAGQFQGEGEPACYARCSSGQPGQVGRSFGRHGDDRRARPGTMWFFSNFPSEVLVEWKQTMRLEFAKNPAEALLDTINSMKKGASVDVELTAAKLPVRSQKEMKAENFIFEFI